MFKVNAEFRRNQFERRFFLCQEAAGWKRPHVRIGMPHCLRRPIPDYSTSAIVRSAIGLMTAATAAMPTFKSSVPIFSSAGLWASAALGEAYNNFEL